MTAVQPEGARAQLRVVACPDAGRVGSLVPLGDEPLTIGRDAANGFACSDGAMSRRHATLSHTPAGWELADLESANGTWCGDRRVDRELITSGQSFRVCETVFLLEESAADQPSPRDEPPPTSAGPSATPSLPSAPPPRQRGRGAFVLAALGVGCLSLLVVGAGVGVAVLSARSRRAETVAAAGTATAFRELAARDYRRALSKLATPDAVRAFAALDEALWPVTRPEVGWAWFFGTSLVSVGGPVKDGTLIAFYNPWADVFLLGRWSADGAGGLRLAEAEVVLGDYVRRRGRPPFEAERLWMRRDVYRPAAVGLAAAETQRAFEALFAPSGIARFSPLRRPWRSALLGLDDRDRLEANRYAAGLVLAKCFAELSPLYNPAPGAQQSVRACLASAFRAALREGLSTLARGAAETPLESLRVLNGFRPSAIGALRPASFLMGNPRSVLLVAMPERPDLYLGLLLSTQGAVSRIERVDLLSFQAFYAAGTTLTRGQR